MGELLSCYDPQWDQISAHVPADAIEWVWLSWPGRTRWLSIFDQWAADRRVWPDLVTPETAPTQKDPT